MSYVESNLLPNEQVTYWAKLHWIIYALPAFVFAVAIPWQWPAAGSLPLQ